MFAQLQWPVKGMVVVFIQDGRYSVLPALHTKFLCAVHNQETDILAVELVCSYTPPISVIH